MNTNEVFTKIKVINGTECVCKKEYVHNNTVIFSEGEFYQVDFGTKMDSDVLAVIQHNQRAYVGMSKSRFAEYFQICKELPEELDRE